MKKKTLGCRVFKNNTLEINEMVVKTFLDFVVL